MAESANPCTHADVMVLSHEDDHQAFPYWHTRIISIYHLMVQERTHEGEGLSAPSQMNILSVWWFGLDSAKGQSSWGTCQLHKIGFIPDTDKDKFGSTFGFLDPNEVLHMVHLIPDFTAVHTKTLLHGELMAIQNPHPDGECPLYYIGM